MAVSKKPAPVKAATVTKGQGYLPKSTPKKPLFGVKKGPKRGAGK